jgi:chromosome partitioning protein
MIFTIGNTKGGVGKSTVALNLAVALAARGHSVWIIDGDRQGTTAMAMGIRAADGKLPQIYCSHLFDGDALHRAVVAQAAQFDCVVIDAGGRDSTALRAALVLSAVVVVPFAPRSLDMWALADMGRLVEEARAHNPALKACAVLSGADAAGRDNQDAAEALANFPQLDYLPTPIRRRKSVANAMGHGLSVLEYTPKDAKAVAEMKSFVDALMKYV